MNVLQHTTDLALHICDAYIKPNSIAVDCTCGNGKDTLWLANRCEKVYAFDIQEVAIEKTTELLEQNQKKNVELLCHGHERIKEYVLENPDVIVFNLGFLPGGDKSITTNTISSLTAIKNALEILAVEGIMSITMYPGHHEGRREQEAILEWARALNSKTYHCVFANMLNQSERAPQILWITKKK